MMRDLRLRYERHFHDSDYETPQARTIKDSKMQMLKYLPR